MRKLLLAFAVPCFFAGSASADGITTSTSCSVSSAGITQTMTGPTTCSTSMGVGTASAEVSYNLNLTVTSPLSDYIGASIAARAIPNPSGYSYSPTIPTEMSADASIALQYTLTTAGPVRPGYVEMDRLLSNAGTNRRNVAGIDNFSNVSALIGSAVSVVCLEDSFECSPSGPGVLFPITLGQPFVFSEQITLRASDSVGGMGIGFDYGDFLESGSAELDFNFRLLEVDGATPVTVDLVPEPSSFALLTGTGLLLAAVRRRFYCGL